MKNENSDRGVMVDGKEFSNPITGYGTDPVNHPSYYNSGNIEVIEAIEDWKLSFHLGNAVKYIARAGKKNPQKTVEDLEKAIWYIRRHLEILGHNPRRPNDMPQERQSGAV